jgi:hypothetical protein
MSVARTISPINERFVRIESDNQEYLGLKIASNRRPQKANRQSEKQQEVGWIVRDNRLTEWPVQGIFEHEGEIYVYGPFLSGKTLNQVLEYSPKNALKSLLEFVNALIFMRENVHADLRIQLNSIIYLEEGGILFFPRTMIERIQSTQTTSERILTFEILNNPDLETDRNYAFSIAVMTYRILTGEWPFMADSEEEIHRQMRIRKILPPHLVRPGIGSEISSAVMRTLGKEEGEPPDLKEWRDNLTAWVRNGYEEPLAAGGRTALEDQAAVLQKKYDRDYRTTTFLHNHWRILAISGVVLVLVGSIVGSILQNVLAPPITVGMSPEQVIETFYLGLNTFDHMTMEDCVTGDAGAEEVREATNLYVISKMREGYEGRSGYVDAQAWIEADRPRLKSGSVPYGHSNLEIRQESEGIYVVDYYKWTVESKDAENPENTTVRTVVLDRRDRLSMENRGEYWVITGIERMQDEPLETIPE